MGVCASSGGMFNNYAIVQGVDHIVPVDMYLPGCPPRPEMLIDAILKLHEKIQDMQLGVEPRAARCRNWSRPGAPAAAGRRPGGRSRTRPTAGRDEPAPEHPDDAAAPAERGERGDSTGRPARRGAAG